MSDERQCGHRAQVHDEVQGATYCATCGDWVLPERSTLLGVPEGETGVRLPPDKD